MGRMLRELRNRLLFFLAYSRKQEELSDEIEFHIQEAIEDRVAAGMDERVARYEVLKEFGHRDSVREECQDSWGMRVAVNFLKDVSFGQRQIAKTKGLYLIIVLSLGVCIGLNAILFGLLDALYFNPSVSINEDRIVRIADRFDGSDANSQNLFTGPSHYLERKEQSTLLEELGFYQSRFATVTEPGGEPDPLYNLYYRLSPSMFDVFGISPHLGRRFTDEDSVPGNHLVVMLDYRLWQTRYGGRDDVLGQTIELAGTQSESNRQIFTIVGVMPEGFMLPSLWGTNESIRRNGNPFYIPWLEQVWHRSEGGRSFVYGGSFGLMKDGVSIESVRSEMRTITDNSGPDYPRAFKSEQQRNHQVVVHSLRDDLIRGVKTEFLFLQLAFAALLLMACTNVAGLVLHRNRMRVPEFLTRLSLGAPLKRIWCQLLVENCLVAFCGGLLGLILAVVGFRLLGKSDAFEVMSIDPRLEFDGKLIAYVGGLAVVAGVMIGGLACLPLAGKLRSGGGLRVDARASSETKGFKRFQQVLIGVQVSLATVLTVFCGLLSTSLYEILDTDTGFDSEDVLTLSYRLPNGEYDEVAKRSFMTDIRGRVETIPGVVSAGTEFFPPMKWGGNSFMDLISERDWRAGVRVSTSALVDSVDSELFSTLGIQVLVGRGFTQADLSNQSRVVVVDEKLAKDFFGGGEAVGQQLALKWPGQSFDSLSEQEIYTVIGVVESVHRTNLINPASEGTIYRHIYDLIPAWSSLVVKMEDEPGAVLERIKGKFSELDSRLSVARPETMEEVLKKSYKSTVYLFYAISGIGLVAIVLNVFGLYGAIRYSIVSNRKEIGIRTALGAVASGIRKSVFKKWMALGGVAIVVGLGLSFFATSLLDGLLYRVGRFEPSVLVAGSVFVMVVLIVSTWVSSNAVIRIDPLRALRDD